MKTKKQKINIPNLLLYTKRKQNEIVIRLADYVFDRENSDERFTNIPKQIAIQRELEWKLVTLSFLSLSLNLSLSLSIS